MGYRNSIFRQYEDTPMDEIPMKDLVWIFSAYREIREFQPFYKEVLNYFFTKDVRVEKVKDDRYQFFFNDYFNPDAGTGERPFLYSYRGLKNSKGELVYEVCSFNKSYYIEKNENHFEISNKYIYYNYKVGGDKMIYEKNPNYYFIDSFGVIMEGAFLMKKPNIPEHTFTPQKFSENLPVKELNQ